MSPDRDIEPSLYKAMNDLMRTITTAFQNAARARDAIELEDTDGGEVNIEETDQDILN